jgi:hypothetical protein
MTLSLTWFNSFLTARARSQRGSAATTVFLSLFVAVLTAAQDTTGAGSLRGRLLSVGGEPAPSQQVCLRAVGCQTADALGRFRFSGLRPGEYELSVAGNAVAVDVRPGLEAEVEVVLTEPATLQQSIEIRESFFLAPEEIKTSQFVIPAPEINSSPAALKDISRYVQTLPGVLFGTNDFRNDLIVRGGSPLENLYIVDNVEIPNINHFANFASAGGPVGQINTELLSDLTFLSGGYPAPYANRLSSVLQLTQREGSREGLRAHASLGFGGGGAILEGPLGKRGSWLASARRSFLDLVTDDIGFGGVPVYLNFQGKALYDLDDRNRVWFSNLGGRDEILIRPQAERKGMQASDRYNVDSFGWRNASGLNWQRILGREGVSLLGLTHSHGSVNNQVGDLSIGGALVSRQRSTEDEANAKWDATFELARLGKLQAGANARWHWIGYDLANPLGLENPFSPEPGRVNRLFIREDFTATQQGVYVQATRQITPRLNLTAGARWDRFGFLGRSRISPRAAFSWRLLSRVQAHFSYGRYFQQPFFLFLCADPVNRGLTPMRSDHLVAGLSWNPQPGLRMTLEAYEKRYGAYPVSLEYPQVTLAAAGDAFGPNYYLLPLTSVGSGRARGVEFYARKTLEERWYGQFNLAVSESRHRALDGVLRPGGFDARFAVNLTAGYRFRRRWEAGIRNTLFSGRPFTPFDRELSRAQNRDIFDLGQVNAVRARAYHRLDIRVDRYWNTGSGTLNLYFGVQNALNRANFMAQVWDFRRNEATTWTQMRMFPIGGMEWRFR